MYLEAVLSHERIEKLIRQFAPIRIHMTPTDEDRRWVELDEPDSVEMVPGRGVRIQCAGRVRYSVGAVKAPFSIRKVVVVLEPRIVQDGIEGNRLAFNIEIEDADLKFVPDMIDWAIMKKVNQALTPRDTHMVWDFGRALAKDAKMPGRLEPLDILKLAVDRGEVLVDKDNLRLRVYLTADLTRTKERPTDD